MVKYMLIVKKYLMDILIQINILDSYQMFLNFILL